MENVLSAERECRVIDEQRFSVRFGLLAWQKKENRLNGKHVESFKVFSFTDEQTMKEFFVCLLKHRRCDELWQKLLSPFDCNRCALKRLQAWRCWWRFFEGCKNVELEAAVLVFSMRIKSHGKCQSSSDDERISNEERKNVWSEIFWLLQDSREMRKDGKKRKNRFSQTRCCCLCHVVGTSCWRYHFRWFASFLFFSVRFFVTLAISFSGFFHSCQSFSQHKRRQQWTNERTTKPTTTATITLMNFLLKFIGLIMFRRRPVTSGSRPV